MGGDSVSPHRPKPILLQMRKLRPEREYASATQMPPGRGENSLGVRPWGGKILPSQGVGRGEGEQPQPLEPRTFSELGPRPCPQTRPEHPPERSARAHSELPVSVLGQWQPVGHRVSVKCQQPALRKAQTAVLPETRLCPSGADSIPGGPLPAPYCYCSVSPVSFSF